MPGVAEKAPLIVLSSLLAGYLLLLLLLTIGSREPLHGEPDRYYLANRSVSAFHSACSLAATSVGGSATIVSCALVFQHGLAGMWIDLGGIFGLVLLGLFLAPVARRSGALSVAELLGSYGPTVRRLGAAVILVAELAWLALLAKSTAALVTPALGWSSESLVMGVQLFAVACYTLLGGQRMVVRSDLLQLALMVIGLVLVAPFYAAGRLAHPLSLGTLHFPFAPSLGPARALAFVPLMALPHLSGPDVLVKVFAARDEQAAQRAVIGAAGLKLLFALAVAFLGLSARALLPAATPPSQALGLLIHEVMPAAVGALVLLALVATTMSSADQVLLSAMTMIDVELWPQQGIAGRRGLRLLGAGAMAGAAWALALAFPNALAAMKLAYTVYASSLALPVLWALFPRLNPDRRIVVFAIVLSGATALLWHFSQPIAALPPVLAGALLNLSLLTYASWAAPRLL